MTTPELIPFSITAFITLLVIVDPIGCAPIFLGLSHEMAPEQKRLTLLRAVTIALSVSLFFLFAGKAVLSYLGVTVHAFTISGGILLFLTALPMLFGQRGGMQAPEKAEKKSVGDDISVFPLAIPLMSGPGAIASILILSGQAAGDVRLLTALVAVIIAVFVLSWLVLRVSVQLVNVLGDGGIHIATRVMGLVLSGLAVQYVLSGVAGYYQTLPVAH